MSTLIASNLTQSGAGDPNIQLQGSQATQFNGLTTHASGVNVTGGNARISGTGNLGVNVTADTAIGATIQNDNTNSTIRAFQVGSQNTVTADEIYGYSVVGSFNSATATTRKAAFQCDIGLNGSINYQVYASGNAPSYFNGGIQFDLTHTNGGTQAQLQLDDYEEGAWTPEIADANFGGNVGTLTTHAIGYYTKIGNMVTIVGRLSGFDTTGLTASGALRIRGFPFSSSNTSVFPNVGSFSGSIQHQNIDHPNDSEYLTVAISSAGEYSTVVTNRKDQPSSSCTVDAFNSTSEVRINITYFVNV